VTLATWHPRGEAGAIPILQSGAICSRRRRPARARRRRRIPILEAVEPGLRKPQALVNRPHPRARRPGDREFGGLGKYRHTHEGRIYAACPTHRRSGRSRVAPRSSSARRTPLDHIERGTLDPSSLPHRDLDERPPPRHGIRSRGASAAALLPKDVRPPCSARRSRARCASSLAASRGRRGGRDRAGEAEPRRDEQCNVEVLERDKVTRSRSCSPLRVDQVLVFRTPSEASTARRDHAARGHAVSAIHGDLTRRSARDARRVPERHAENPERHERRRERLTHRGHQPRRDYDLPETRYLHPPLRRTAGPAGAGVGGDVRRRVGFRPVRRPPQEARSPSAAKRWSCIAASGGLRFVGEEVFREEIARRTLVCDGAMGTMLFSSASRWTGAGRDNLWRPKTVRASIAPTLGAGPTSSPRTPTGAKPLRLAPFGIQGTSSRSIRAAARNRPRGEGCGAPRLHRRPRWSPATTAGTARAASTEGSPCGLPRGRSDALVEGRVISSSSETFGDLNELLRGGPRSAQTTKEAARGRAAHLRRRRNKRSTGGRSTAMPLEKSIVPIAPSQTRVRRAISSRKTSSPHESKGRR